MATQFFSEDELRDRLTDDQYGITQEKGTEAAFTGEYYKHVEDGMYCCVVCDAALFSSDTKYDSGSGWPSFYLPASSDALAYHNDVTHGMRRKEVTCKRCGAHLGHVFPDGPRSIGEAGKEDKGVSYPKPDGKRFCINSGALAFQKK